MQYVRFNVFSAGNLIFNLVMIYVGMYLAGMLDEFSIIDVILPFGFGFGLLFFRPLPRISEKACTRLHLRSDIKTVVWGSIMLLLWVSVFGSGDESGHAFYVYILYAAGLLLLRKFILLRAIYGLFLDDQFEPKCKICDPIKYGREPDEDDEDDEDD